MTETPVPTRKFDWFPHHDERSRGFALSHVVPVQPEVPKLWTAGPLLDQGSEGACVGFGWTNELMATPKPFHPTAEHANEYAFGYYHRAKELDEYPGEDYEGSSVLGGAKVAVERGFIDEYRWCFGVEDVRNAIIATGPVVIGVSWYEGMYQTNNRGLVTVSGARVGGHCLLVTGYNPAMKFLIDGQWVTLRVFRWRNSWGPYYGYWRNGARNGNGWITYDNLSSLLSEDGEAAIPWGRHDVSF